jgi:hypothetical protein
MLSHGHLIFKYLVTISIEGGVARNYMHNCFFSDMNCEVVARVPLRAVFPTDENPTYCSNSNSQRQSLLPIVFTILKLDSLFLWFSIWQNTCIQ